VAGPNPKRVTILRFDREPLPGYASAGTLWTPGGMELLSAAGTLLAIPAGDVKVVCFVRTWEEPSGIETRKTFVSRPKVDGLWVRFEFRDGDSLEGLTANRLTEWSAGGVYAAPPDAAGNTQRIFVPAAALAGCQVLGVIGAAKQSRKPKTAAERQLRMFE
jgi:hypothetical protein